MERPWRNQPTNFKKKKKRRIVKDSKELVSAGRTRNSRTAFRGP
jgi:hypothetical protein